MHRTVERKHLLSRPAEVNGTKPKSLRTWYGEIHIKNSRAGFFCPAVLYMEVFSSCRGAKPRTPRSKAEYNFATVYLREVLFYPEPPEKANSEIFYQVSSHRSIEQIKGYCAIISPKRWEEYSLSVFNVA